MLTALLFISLFVGISDAQQISLSSLRPQMASQAPYQSRTQSLPSTFLPLCGNGRLDTIEDYKASQITATFTAYTPLPLIQQTQATIFATEVCDDGNRLDFDGCSADCMHRDLWVDPCELQIDSELQNIEAIVYSPQHDAMILSTASAMYQLDTTPHNADEKAVHTILLAPKSDSLIGLFWNTYLSQVIAYSAQQQVLYSLSQTNTLDMYLNLSSVLNPSINNAFHYEAQNLLVLHDNSTVALVNMTSGLLQGQCKSSIGIEHSVYLGVLTGNTLSINPTDFGVNARLDVTPSAQGLQCTSTNFGWSGMIVNDIFKDTFKIVIGNMVTNYQQYNATAIVNNTPTTLSYYETYIPLGLWFEMPYSNSPRLLLERGPDYSSISTLSSWIGNPLLMDALDMISQFTCASKAQCYLDTDSVYDLFSQSRQLLGAGSWQATIENIIFSQTVAFNKSATIRTMQDVYSNATLYRAILKEWSDLITQIGITRQVRAYASDPKTGNLWVIAPNNLTLKTYGVFVIGKSGMQLKLPNSEKCMPAGIAICPLCSWAPAGAKCMPCSQQPADGLLQQASWAWSVQCSASSACASGKGRRRSILASSAPAPVQIIEFRVQGSASTSLQGLKCLGSAVWSPQDQGNWIVRVAVTAASDPAACMRDIMGALSPDQIQVKPHIMITLSTLNDTSTGLIILEAPPPPSSTDTNLSVGAIVGIAVGGVVLLLIIVVVYIEYFHDQGHHPFYHPLHFHRDHHSPRHAALPFHHIHRNASHWKG